MECDGRMSSRTSLPKTYYARMNTSPGMWTELVRCASSLFQGSGFTRPETGRGCCLRQYVSKPEISDEDSASQKTTPDASKMYYTTTCISICIFLCISICISVCIFICIPISISVCIPFGNCWSVSFSVEQSYHVRRQISVRTKFERQAQLNLELTF